MLTYHPILTGIGSDVINIVRRIYHYTLLIFLVFALCPLISLGQETATIDRIDAIKNIIPPSPEAASLGKYTQWPVNLNSGLANISISLYNLKGRTISVPVSVSYHGSGIRVGDVASSIGLGWSLISGGLISKTVNGLSDSQDNGYFNLRKKYSDADDLSSAVVSGSNDQQNKSWVADGLYDAEQDSYTLNALGRSYKIIVRGNNEIVTIPTSQIKISADFDNDIWTVVLEDGTVLVFGGDSGFTEKTDNPRQEIDLYTSSWLLQSITSPTGETIKFTYQMSSGVGQMASASRKDKIENNLNMDGEEAATNGIASCSCNGASVNTPSGAILEQTVGIQLLASIESDIEKIEFILGAPREDLEGGHPYAGAKVFSKLRNVYTEEYRFNMSYSQAITGNTYAISNSYQEKRLRLNSIDKLIPGSSSIISKWSFEYNPQNLPSRVSNAQDHFGYFNGATRNETFLPALPPVGYYDGFSPNNYKRGSRDVNPDYLQAEMLTKIVYPTNGYSQFVYEPNSYIQEEEQFKDESLSLSISSSETTFQETKVTAFDVTKEQYIYIEAKAVFSQAYLNDHSTSLVLGGASIIDPQGNTVGTISFKRSGEDHHYITIKKKLGASSFSPGTYKFRVWSRGDYSNPGDIYISALIRYSKPLGVQSVNKLVGGLRIKSIQDFDNIGKSPVARFFQYDDALVMKEFNSVDEYITVFTEQTKERLAGNEGTTCDYRANGTGECFQEYLVRSAYAKTGIASVPISYGRVTILYGEHGENGRTISVFSNKGDDNIAESIEFPYPPTLSNEWQRGTLLKEIQLNAALDTLLKTEHQYTAEHSNSRVTLFKVGRSTTYHTFYGDPYKYNGIKTAYYVLATGRNRLIKTTETHYSSDTKLGSITSYFYDNPLNFEATRIETTDSDNKVKTTKRLTALEKNEIQTRYGDNVTSETLESIDYMLSKNIINQVIASEESREEALVKTTLTNYKLTDGKVLPVHIMMQEGTGAFETRMYYKEYDAKGNLIEQARPRDVSHSYIWDYTSSYAVAEVYNASYKDVAFTSFEADGTGSWNVPAGRLSGGITGLNCYSLSNGNITRTGLDVTLKYVVSFWANNSSVQINGTPATAGISANGFTHFTITVSSVSSVNISGSALIDELRLYPEGAQMTTYTYEPSIGITSGTDMNNRTVYYEYDSGNRLLFIRDHDKNILKHYEYNYQRR